MQLKLKLQAQQQTVPINYQHFLSSAIYNYLATADIKFSSDLHESKNFKFFTFSWLQFPRKKIINSSIKILSPEFFWYISSPWNEFVQNLVNGLLELGGLRIGQYTFPITQTETLPDVILIEAKNLKFSCLSPLVITTKKEYNGKLAKYYYKPNDNLSEISEKIRQNLINKYTTFFGKEPKDTKLKIEFDNVYIKSPKAQVLMHYIKSIFSNSHSLPSIHHSGRSEESRGKTVDIKIPAIMCPFTVTGSQELIKFGYECGFGELNSAGFGMVRRI
ncbi:MAG: CRISPR associated protein Cas6 [Elusimicrobia bacterium ADurb.Bin231]|nr:MAG: CRISPR associated protein Cas6 [Elusimicrobia bacterium ADurb.Bin231]